MIFFLTPYYVVRKNQGGVCVKVVYLPPQPDPKKVREGLAEIIRLVKGTEEKKVG